MSRVLYKLTSLDLDKFKSNLDIINLLLIVGNPDKFNFEVRFHVGIFVYHEPGRICKNNLAKVGIFPVIDGRLGGFGEFYRIGMQQVIYWRSDRNEIRH